EFFGGQLDGLALDQDFVTIKVHPKRSRVILDLRFEAGLPTSQDGADAGDQFTDTLTAHDQIDSLLIGVQTLFILAREVSFSDGDDGHHAPLASPSEMRNGIRSVVKNH